MAMPEIAVAKRRETRVILHIEGLRAEMQSKERNDTCQEANSGDFIVFKEEEKNNRSIHRMNSSRTRLLDFLQVLHQKIVNTRLEEEEEKEKDSFPGER